ncbi:MAG: response regulator transcription factor [Syntrophales bacterium]|nr:response regulator transcription factor [Syntrophales bacterium]
MTILLSSANRAVIKRWSDLLASYPLEQASSLAELKSRCTGKTFDLVLLHRSLVDLACFAALRKLTPSIRVFLLSDQPNEEEGFEFLKMGIAGYGNTYISPARLIEAIRIITAGGVWLGQQVIQKLIIEAAARAKAQAGPDAAKKLAELTRREQKVAEMVAWGRTNLEIAADLKITERTVKAHLTSVYDKTKSGNRLSLALLINRG